MSISSRRRTSCCNRGPDRNRLSGDASCAPRPAALPNRTPRELLLRQQRHRADARNERTSTSSSGTEHVPSEPHCFTSSVTVTLLPGAATPPLLTSPPKPSASSSSAPVAASGSSAPPSSSTTASGASGSYAGLSGTLAAIGLASSRGQNSSAVVVQPSAQSAGTSSATWLRPASRPLICAVSEAAVPSQTCTAAASRVKRRRAFVDGTHAIAKAARSGRYKMRASG